MYNNATLLQKSLTFVTIVNAEKNVLRSIPVSFL